jgi:hypothetical protein
MHSLRELYEELVENSNSYLDFSHESLVKLLIFNVCVEAQEIIYTLFKKKAFVRGDENLKKLKKELHKQ